MKNEFSQVDNLENYLSLVCTDEEASSHVKILDTLKPNWDLVCLEESLLYLQETTQHPAPFTLALRKFPSSDLEVFEQLYFRKFYQPFIECVTELQDGSLVNTVVDIGANIGLAAVLFAREFMNATVWSIEPQQGNFLLLEHNARLNSFLKIQPIRGALWNLSRTLSVTQGFRDGREWAYQVREEEGEDQVPGFTLTDFHHSFLKKEPIDILKLDLQGAEFSVLSDPTTQDLIRKQVHFICFKVYEECGDAKQLLSLMDNLFKLHYFEEVVYGPNRYW